MKKTSILSIFLVSVLAFGCKRDAPVYPTTAKTADAVTTIKAYMTVNCDNCEIQYGMPDQYKQLTNSGTSGKLAYNYTGKYTFVAYVTPINVDQTITVSVYDNTGTMVYSGSKLQPAGTYWETDTAVGAAQ